MESQYTQPTFILPPHGDCCSFLGLHVFFLSRSFSCWNWARSTCTAGMLSPPDEYLISCFHPTWLKLVVLGNKQARTKFGQTGCVPTQGVASIKESPTWGMLSHPVTQFEMIKKSEEYLDMRLAGFDQSLLCLKNKTGHDILKTIHLETIIK